MTYRGGKFQGVEEPLINLCSDDRPNNWETGGEREDARRALGKGDAQSREPVSETSFIYPRVLPPLTSIVSKQLSFSEN